MSDRWSPPQVVLDQWSVEANIHLVAYLKRRSDPKRYHPDPRNGNISAWPGPEGTARTNILLTGKNIWAKTMKDAADEGNLPDDNGQDWFEDIMRNCELQIDARIHVKVAA